MKAIIVADENELAKLPFAVKETKTINQFEFTIFTNDIIFVHSGIGIVNAAAATQALIDNFSITEIWNYGAVGGNKHVAYKDVITPEKIFFHDVVTPWYQRGQTPGEKPYFKNDLKLEKTNNIASGSSFITGKETIKLIKKELDVDLFDMEVAAIAQIADKNNIPLKVIKCVSDSIGHTDDALGNINDRIKVAGEIALKKLLSEITIK